jgi:hypothetical protein
MAGLAAVADRPSLKDEQLPIGNLSHPGERVARPAGHYRATVLAGIARGGGADALGAV